MNSRRRRGITSAMLSMLIFIGSIISLLALLGTSYTGQANGNIGAGGAVINNGQQISVAGGPASGKNANCVISHNGPSAAQQYANCKARGSGGDTVLSFVGTPLGTTVAIALLFVGLGIFAGLMGAGLLGNLIAGVGITLALVNYITGTINDLFGTVPVAIVGLVNVIVIAVSIYMIADMLSGKY